MIFSVPLRLCGGAYADTEGKHPRLTGGEEQGQTARENWLEAGENEAEDRSAPKVCVELSSHAAAKIAAQRKRTAAQQHQS
jgi:hypothetical protein